MSHQSPMLFDDHSLPLFASSEQIREFAKTLSDSCKRTCNNKLAPISTYIYRLNTLASKLGIPPLRARYNVSKGGVIARFLDPSWWAGQIRKIQKYKIELREIKRGKVHKYAGCYISDNSLERHRARKVQSQEILAGYDLINEEGERISLSDAIESSVSNPRNRRSELMCRIAGVEQYAKEVGMVGTFLTFTCPSRMHARHSRNGRPNRNYDGTTPKEAHQYLNTVWQRIRAKLHRSNIAIYGLRVVEPQHDGTPHWHLLLFHDKPHFHELSEICMRYNLADSGTERGAKKYRVNIKPIDRNIGTATGYIAKYISKNIDGAHLDKDTYGNDAAASAERIEAWASTWGIRQFQSLGTPAVTIWRELRKIKAKLPDGILKSGQKAADDSDWCSFQKIMQKLTGNEKSSIKLERVWSDKLGKYGDPKGMEIFGVSDEHFTYQTRVHNWTLVDKLTDPIDEHLTEAKKQASADSQSLRTRMRAAL